MRTQQQILDRYNSVKDLMGIQQTDLLDLMDFETVKPYLKPEYISSVEEGKEKFEFTTDLKKTILEYLPFAYEKAEGGRGISAERSLLHFKTWIWFDDPDFYEKIESSLTHYTNYGLSVLDKISEKYGYVNS